MDDAKFWDPDQVDVSMGAIPLSGFAEGSMIEYEPDGDQFNEVDGVDGTLTRSKKVVRKGTITVHLMSTSNSNDVLTGFHAVDLAAPGGAGVVPFVIRDRNGATLMTFPKSWVMAFPKVTMADKAQDQAWKIRVVSPPNGAPNIFLGGT